MKNTFTALLITCILSVFTLPAFACDGFDAFAAESPVVIVASAIDPLDDFTADKTIDFGNSSYQPYKASESGHAVYALAPGKMKNAIQRHGLEVTVSARGKPT